VDDTIVIKPTWEVLTEQKENDLVIEIDPGTSFGTGSHETTKLCILGIKKYLEPEMDMLDVGCGSGILSIIGKKLQAGKVLATDIDPNAILSAGENAAVNKVENDIEFISGDIISDHEVQIKVGMECYDIAVANILADVIIPLSAEIGSHLKPGGLFISSGIINTKKEQVKKAILENGFEVIEINEMGDWVSIVAKKAADF
jgi:ribosomal protein L11 methyltransferase